MTYAVRDTEIDGKTIKQNDFMGIGDKSILSVGTDLKAVSYTHLGDSHAAGSTGGEETHTLTKAEIPDHAHTLKYTGQSVTEGVNAIRLYQAASNQYNEYSGGQSSDCGDQAHNNMPPYLAVYTWRRTA